MQLRCRRRADEIVFEPRKLEALGLDGQHLGHVAANHPADMNPHFLFLVDLHVGLLPCRPYG